METWDEYAAIRPAIRSNPEPICESGPDATRLRVVLVKMRLRRLCDGDEGHDDVCVFSLLLDVDVVVQERKVAETNLKQP